ncbi:hypothetical protein SUGI_0898660 [Cryptomeria japonica]|nr:hypothetical protein SUGI_0898660 [Cryptomeria japonica]
MHNITELFQPGATIQNPRTIRFFRRSSRRVLGEERFLSINVDIDMGLMSNIMLRGFPIKEIKGYRKVSKRSNMALREFLGWSNGELMRSDAKPCSTMIRQTAGIFSVCGALAFWTLGRVYYGPRITIPRALRWGLCGAVSGSCSSALLVRLFLPEYCKERKWDEQSAI